VKRLKFCKIVFSLKLLIISEVSVGGFQEDDALVMQPQNEINGNKIILMKCYHMPPSNPRP
jgi:hypothetical protein